MFRKQRLEGAAPGDQGHIENQDKVHERVVIIGRILLLPSHVGIEVVARHSHTQQEDTPDSAGGTVDIGGKKQHGD